MARPTIVDGLDTYYLPYPQTYKEVRTPRANEFTSYLGTVQRDYRTGWDKYPLTVFLGWEELSTADMTDINTVYRLMAATIDTGYAYVDPAGSEWIVRLNPEQPNLQSQRYAGPEGTVLYTARLSFALEE